MNKTDCVFVDASSFEWIYFFAGMSWWLMGYYCLSCANSLRLVREQELRLQVERERVITAQAVEIVNSGHGE